MKITSRVSELKKMTSAAQKHPLGLVPTMGALHEGHLSLVRNAMARCPAIVITIYVNPTQFNDREDLKNYPSNPGQDLAFLRDLLREDDIVFMPGDREIYPVEDKRKFGFGNLDRVMEAVHRPGHFNGVAQVVSRLFEIVNPDFAYFGQKDFQQLAVIRELVRQTGSSVAIISNPIIREHDGLAMSSRNQLLEPAIRKNAGIIYRTLTEASQMTNKNDIAHIKKYVAKTIEKLEGFDIEYFEFVDEKDLIPSRSTTEIRKDLKYFGCIAVKAGKIRLIDNIEIPLNQSNS